MMLEIAGGAALAVWLYLLLGRGEFWRMPVAGHQGALPFPAPKVVCVIPARNESAVIVKAIGSLAGQQYPGLHIVVVDDASTDGTAALARSAASAELLSVVQAAPLPAHWTGKLWAISEGIRAAAGWSPDYLLLTDADIVHAPGSVASLVARANAGGHGLVSLMVKLHCATVAERALVPAFVFFFFMLYPPAWISDRRHRTAGAAGGCMLVRTELLERIGGIAAIRGELIDDCALARAIKATGASVWLGLSDSTLSIREYQSFSEIGRMISRTAFTQLQHSGLLLAGTVAGLAITYLAPPVAALAGTGRAAAIGAAAWVLMSITYLPALRFYHRSPLWAPFLPVIASFYMGATVHSAVAYWRGEGGLWKGRTQDPTP